MEPEVVYNDEAFGRFLDTNWKEEGLCTVEEQSGESPSPARRRGSDPSPDRIPGYYQKIIENDDDRDLRGSPGRNGGFKFDVNKFDM